MPKKNPELSAKQVRDLSTRGMHAVGGVSGLHLRINDNGAKSWILRYTTGEPVPAKSGKAYLKRRDLGLGGFPDVGLGEAREAAREAKKLIKQGIDPVEQRKAVRREYMQSMIRAVTFQAVAADAFEVKRQEFKNSKHAAQWISTLENYAFPIIGKMPVDEIEASDVLAVLKPIWTSKTETATRVRQRMATVFDHALATGTRTKPNPAAWKGCLEPLLPTPEKLKKRSGKANNHHPALPIDQMQRFMQDLIGREGNGARALEFAILTAARSGEVRFAVWDEIDFENKQWRLSAERMKAERPHVVPLCDQAIKLLESLPRESKLIFPSSKGLELSDATLSAAIKRMHADDIDKNGSGYLDPVNGRIATPHGFRSTFKDWTRQKARFPDEWSELALAHVNSDQTRAAYARNELLEERAEMMQAWADFCHRQKSGKVLEMVRG